MKIKKIVILLIVCKVMCAGTLFARLRLNAGTRALSVGTAYTGVPEELDGIFYNPASLAGIKDTQLMLNTGRVDTGKPVDASEMQAAFTMPTPYGNKLLKMKGKPLSITTGLAFTGQSADNGVHVVNVYACAASTIPLHDIAPWFPWQLSAGTTLRIRAQNGHKKEPSVGKTNFGPGLDIGAIVPFTKRLSIGLALRNLFPPSANPDGPSLAIGSYFQKEESFNLFTDLEVRSGGVWSVHPGAELLFFKGILRPRIGWGYRQAGIDHITTGFGVYLSPIQLDAAYAMPIKSINDPTSQFRVSLTYKFNVPTFSDQYFYHALSKAADMDKKVFELSQREKTLSKSLDDLIQERKIAEEELTNIRARIEDPAYQDKLYKAIKSAQESEEKARQLESELKGARGSLQQIYEQRKVEKEKVKETAAKPKTYVVQPGDTLRDLAKKFYGDPARWKAIYDANPDKIERGRPREGETLTIP